MNKILIGAMAVLIALAIAGGSVAIKANQKVGKLKTQNEQWSMGYEYLAGERKRLDGEATKWRARHKETSNHYETKVRQLGRYKVIAQQKGAECIDAAVPSAVVELMRSRTNTPSTDILPGSTGDLDRSSAASRAAPGADLERCGDLLCGTPAGS